MRLHLALRDTQCRNMRHCRLRRFELRCAKGPGRWVRRSTKARANSKQSSPRGEDYSPGRRNGLHRLAQIRTPAISQRDESSLCTSKFESDMPSMQSVSGTCSRQDARAGADQLALELGASRGASSALQISASTAAGSTSAAACQDACGSASLSITRWVRSPLGRAARIRSRRAAARSRGADALRHRSWQRLCTRCPAGGA
jgi:hypothetical protein